MSEPIRVIIGPEDFRILVSGKVMEQNDVKIILQDIGYQRMAQIIVEESNKP